MNGERLKKAESIFQFVAELPPDERVPILTEHCGENTELRAFVERMLANHDQGMGDFLRIPERVASETREGPRLVVAMPKRIGQYHIKRVIATGGMGTVYEAVQERPRRTVALKVMKQGIASRSALRRFEYESQILARLRHPGIAQVYEAGTHRDESGTVPYFAMEYIPNARPINKYAKEKKLGTRERLALFSQVCDAVQHGHQKGIIHRDLKPANILVDPQAQPKIIDFGVARGTDSDMAVTTLQTDVGQLIGTLQYMSPEQCEADPHDIDTRSDVYALGVVLYELLCGKLPYDVTRVAMYEATRIIREQHPTKLSTIKRALRGDVETIALKALEKDRERRYQSADELRRDIENYLNGEPITARPPSVAYQLKILARRNKALVGGVAVAFVALTVGFIGTSIGLVKARAARNGAEQVTAFLEDMIAFADPHETKHPNVTMREALDRAAKTIGGKFKDKPLIEARLRNTIGETYRGLGVYTDAELHLRGAIRIRRRVLGDEHPDTLDSMNYLGWVLVDHGKSAEAETLLRRTVEMRRRVLGDEHPDTLDSMDNLGRVLWEQGKYGKAETLLRRTLGMRRRVLGDEAGGTLWSMYHLGLVLQKQGKHADAERLLRQTLELRRRASGEEHPATLWAMNGLGEVLGSQGKSAEAETLLRHTIDIQRRVLGEEYRATLASMSSLGLVLGGQGKYAEAEALHRQTLEIKRRVLGNEHPHTLWSINGLVHALRARGKLDEARPYVTELIAHRKRAAEASDAGSGALNDYAWLLLTCEPGDLRDPAAALPIAKRAVEVSEAKNPNILDTLALAQKMTGDLDQAIETQGKAVALLPPGEWRRRTEFETRLADLLVEAGRFAETEPLLLDSYAKLKENPQELPLQVREVRLREALERIVKLYESWCKPDKAAEYRAMLPESNERPHSAAP